MAFFLETNTATNQAVGVPPFAPPSSPVEEMPTSFNQGHNPFAMNASICYDNLDRAGFIDPLRRNEFVQQTLHPLQQHPQQPQNHSPIGLDMSENILNERGPVEPAVCRHRAKARFWCEESRKRGRPMEGSLSAFNPKGAQRRRRFSMEVASHCVEQMIL